MAELTQIEVERGDLPYPQKIRAVEVFYRYLWNERATTKTPFNEGPESGADYVLEHIRGALLQAKNPMQAKAFQSDILDI